MWYRIGLKCTHAQEPALKTKVVQAWDTEMHEIPLYNAKWGQFSSSQRFRAFQVRQISRQMDRQTLYITLINQSDWWGRYYLLNMPILISVVITDPSISPKNLPAYQERSQINALWNEPSGWSIKILCHDWLTERISTAPPKCSSLPLSPHRELYD